MSKKLVLYFSVYESTKKLAEDIAKEAGADIVEIIPEIPYDSDRSHYSLLAKLAKREHDEDARPKIANSLPIADYDAIFIGYPMWWYTFPMIIYSLFDAYDFSGKTVIPFNTHMGSRDGGTYKTVKELAKGATVKEGMPVEMTAAESGQSENIKKWLAKLGV